ncbi:MAG: hypothetical protein Q4Q00_00710 [Turicibacter sp.]|nr:hypothetical protein [Turicibacter sp.]
MEQKADYAELRRLYFSPREQDKTPSHSNVSNFESKIEDEPLETPSSRLHEVITSTLDANEMFSSICQDEVNEFKTQLSQRSNDIINTLQDKYGTRTYSKITQMIKSEDFSEWDQLEQELLSVQIDSLVDHELKESKLEQPNLASVAFDESFEELALAADADLDYLDALVQHDYGRLCRLQSDSESISSIFSEILENEQKSNSNYQDDIFNKNIELIFNSDVDLDDCEWEVIERAENKPLAANLDEAIDQLKQSSVLKEPTDKGLTIDHKQASLDAFYSEQKKEEIKSKDVFVSDENQGKINNRVQAKTFNKSILMVGIIVLAVIIYFILQ